jgi:hypothetical protein
VVGEGRGEADALEMGPTPIPHTFGSLGLRFCGPSPPLHSVLIVGLFGLNMVGVRCLLWAMKRVLLFFYFSLRNAFSFGCV